MMTGTIKNIVLLPLFITLSGCTNSGSFLATSGPSRSVVEKVGKNQADAAIPVLTLSAELVAQVGAYAAATKFSDVFPSTTATTGRAGAGDLVEVTLWETPPAVLFSTSGVQSSSSGKELALPEQMVDSRGNISVPFVGNINIQGKTTSQVENAIVARLKGRANKPQAFVRIVKNNNSTVTVVGSSGNNRLIPLSAKNERLLEAIALAGGINDAINRISIQLTRQDRTVSMPLENIVNDARQNVYLNSGDIITIQNQPLNFTVLGASGKNEEIGFESKGISLAQALGRAGGLQDYRADARGVFIFRFEDPSRLKDITPLAANPQNLIDGKFPVIYQIDLKNPQTFFWSQKFMIKNSDMVYISNAPSSELNKFISMITSSLYSVSAARGI
jgi:polysaccharide export outer membrane protein